MPRDARPRPIASRRVRRVRIGLFVVALSAFGFVTGYVAHRERIVTRANLQQVGTFLKLSRAAQSADGHWNPIQPINSDADLDPEQRREMRKLLSLGYAAGTVPAPRDSGVTVCDTSLAAAAPRLYVSGHAPTALLIDRDGRMLHRWRFDYPDAWRDETTEEITQSGFAPNTGCWRRAHLLPGGELLAIFEGRDLVKLDRDSNLIWRFAAHNHHDVDVLPDGTIYVLTREAGLVPSINEKHPVLLDYITELDAQGRPQRRVSIIDAFLRSDFAPHLDRMARRGDLLHTNTLTILDGRLASMSPIFARGNALISIRELNLIAIVDLATERVVWALSGLWVKQHEPSLMPDGNLLVFDNLGNGGRSRVLEIDPFSQQVVWTYADGPGRSLFSQTCGASQRLPGGTTLIVESDNGRALEVTRDGTIVWEFRNPRRTGADNELIAAILDLVVLPADFDLSWLGRPSG